MKANPEKFQAIALGSKANSLGIVFKIQDIEIKCEDEVKLLGVTFDFMLGFNSHIANICRKASRQLNVMKRLGKYLNKLGRLTMYHSFVMSNFNYCPLTWHFTSETNTKKIEKIQERALRFIYNDYTCSYDSLLHLSGLPTLRIRRMRNIALETYKILNCQGPSYLHDLVNYKNSSYNFRYKNLVEIPHPRTERYGKRSFKYTAGKVWNSLPDEYRRASSFSQFKNFMSGWNGERCSCSSCS